MGIIFSRWKIKRSRTDILDDLIKKIDRMERKRQGNLERQKRMVTLLIVYSVLVYLLAALVIFAYWVPDDFIWKAVYSIPFFIFPLLIWSIKRFLHWYYVKNIKKNEKELEKLKDQKITLLNEVKETETYNVAQELLQRFDPDNNINLNNIILDNQHHHDNSLLSNASSTARKSGNESTLRHRGKLTKTHQEPDKPQPPGQQHQQQQQLQKLPFNLPQPSKSPLKRDRTFFDRLVDYLLGDGPGNRYALICDNCYCHNGLALIEEFEYMTFRCSYCCHLNKKKNKPNAPKINQLTNLSTSQTNNLLINQTNNLSISQTNNLSINQPMDQSINQSMDQSINHKANQSQPYLSFNQPTNHSTPKHTTNQPENLSIFSSPIQPANQITNGSTNQTTAMRGNKAFKESKSD